MKERRFKTVDNRWGEGRVHRLLWSPENRVWHIACHETSHVQPYGDRVADDTPLTCKRCLR